MTICSRLLEIKAVLNKGTCGLRLKIKSLHHSCCHMITIWVLGNPFTFLTCCQTSYGQVITFWSLPCWLPQKVDGIEASLFTLVLLILHAKIQVGFSVPEWGNLLFTLGLKILLGFHHGGFSDPEQRGSSPSVYWSAISLNTTFNITGNAKVAVVSFNNCFAHRLRFSVPVVLSWRLPVVQECKLGLDQHVHVYIIF